MATNGSRSKTTSKTSSGKTAKRKAPAGKSKGSNKPATAVAEDEAKKSSAKNGNQAKTDNKLEGLPKDEPTPMESDSGGSVDDETHAKYEEVKRGTVHITELQKMNIAELHEVAKKEGLEEISGLKKQDLIFKILKQRIHQTGMMYGEGSA